MIDVNIRDPETGVLAKVSPQGELFTRQLKFAQAKFQSMDTINTAFNFFVAKAHQKFIVTGALINTNKDVGVNGAIIDLYEASSATSTTIDTQVARLNLLKNQVVALPSIFFGVTEGKFVNGKTDDATVNITVGGYFIDI